MLRGKQPYAPLPRTAGKDSKAKAQSAAKAVKKGAMKKERKIRKSVIFHRPKTLKRTREPKYPRVRCAYLVINKNLHRNQCYIRKN